MILRGLPSHEWEALVDVITGELKRMEYDTQYDQATGKWTAQKGRQRIVTTTLIGEPIKVESIGPKGHYS